MMVNEATKKTGSKKPPSIVFMAHGASAMDTGRLHAVTLGSAVRGFVLATDLSRANGAPASIGYSGKVDSAFYGNTLLVLGLGEHSVGSDSPYRNAEANAVQLAPHIGLIADNVARITETPYLNGAIRSKVRIIIVKGVPSDETQTMFRELFPGLRPDDIFYIDGDELPISLSNTLIDSARKFT